MMMPSIFGENLFDDFFGDFPFYYDKDMKNVEKIWKESDGEQTLAALLEKMTKDELVKVAKKYDVKGITSLKKAEVVERIREVIIKNVDLMINSLEETSIKFLQELINYGGVKKYQCDLLINSNFLRNRGIVFTASINGELYVILPEELRVLLKEKITKDVMAASREKSDLIKAIAGSTYYYGVVSYSAIREILESTFNTEVTDEKIKETKAKETKVKEAKTKEQKVTKESGTGKVVFTQDNSSKNSTHIMQMRGKERKE